MCLKFMELVMFNFNWCVFKALLKLLFFKRFLSVFCVLLKFLLILKIFKLLVFWVIIWSFWIKFVLFLGYKYIIKILGMFVKFFKVVGLVFLFVEMSIKYFLFFFIVRLENKFVKGCNVMFLNVKLGLW